MRSEFLSSEWEDLCQRLAYSAACLGKAAGQAEAFSQAAQEFSQAEPPNRYEDLLERVSAAAELAKQWQVAAQQAGSGTAAVRSSQAAGQASTRDQDLVDEAIDESFPSSDPPAWTHSHA